MINAVSEAERSQNQRAVRKREIRVKISLMVNAFSSAESLRTVCSCSIKFMRHKQ